VKFPWQRSTTDQPTAGSSTTTASDPSGGGKGRPTPTRKEAEAARKHALHVPKDAKEAKKAARARAAEERSEQRAALMSGDERALPARDAGPVKKYVRDYIDGRFAAAELFLPLALVVLVSAFVPNSSIKAFVTMLWMVITIVIIADTTLLTWRMNRELRKRWPDAADRKGASLYGVMRVLQFRRLRLPPPAVRRGGAPVTPKS
jgi:hypothetical protein